MTFGTGWLLDGGLPWSLDRHHASAAHLSAARERMGSLADAGGVERPALLINQGARESCTGEMGVQMIHALNGVACSSQVPWWGSRIRDARGAPLSNAGVSMRAFMWALENLGACPLSDCDPGQSYAPHEYPSADASRFAQKCNLDLVQLFAIGESVVTGIVDALAQGLPCGIALRADAAYGDPEIRGGEAFVGPEMGPGGLHAVYVSRYRFRNGRVEFFSPGSWGSGFGIDGAVWLDQSRVANSYFAGFARSVS